jgi:hypothetical protein
VILILLPLREKVRVAPDEGFEEQKRRDALRAGRGVSRLRDPSKSFTPVLSPLVPKYVPARTA